MTLAVWLLAAAALGCAALTQLHALLGVALATAVAFAASLVVSRQNTPAVRRGHYVAAAGHAAALYLATRDPWLASAALVLTLPLYDFETLRRLNTRLTVLQPLFGVLVAAPLLLLARGSGLWLLALVPAGGLAAMFGLGALMMLRAGGSALARSPLRPGSLVPDFELPYRDGDGTFKLSERRGHLVLLVFVRGDWCPVCHVMMRIVSREEPLLKAHGIELVIITPTQQPMGDALRAGLGIASRVLHDSGAELALSLGLIERSKDSGEKVPLPVTLLVGPDGKLLHLSRPDDVTDYASESRIAATLRACAA